MFENFKDVKNFLFISDDIIVYGFKEDGSDRDQALDELLDRKKGKELQTQTWYASEMYHRDIILQSHRILEWCKTRPEKSKQSHICNHLRTRNGQLPKTT